MGQAYPRRMRNSAIPQAEALIAQGFLSRDRLNDVEAQITGQSVADLIISII
jgi:hypothetical protein